MQLFWNTFAVCSARQDYDLIVIRATRQLFLPIIQIQHIYSGRKATKSQTQSATMAFVIAKACEKA